MAEFGATDDLAMTTDESSQLVEVMNDIKSGHYPAVALELLRRLKIETKAKENLQPALAVFGRFLVGNRVAHFPDDVIAWRTERDYLSLLVDELNDVIGRLCALVPRNASKEDVFTALKRLSKEREALWTQQVDLRQSVESFLQQFGSWVEPNGTRHCNGLHLGHRLCEALND